MTFDSVKSDTNGAHSAPDVLTLVSSTRLTPNLSVHIFTVQANHDFNQSFRPGQHLTIQLPPDLDPVSGPQNLSEEDRRLSLTPYHVGYADNGVIETISFMARNGRVTGLLGLPRPHSPLVATIVQAGGGFPRAILDSSDRLVCIAGGTGIAPFIAMAMARNQSSNPEGGERKPVLLCTIRGNDFGAIEYLLTHQLLHPKDWSILRIFITNGEEEDGLIDGKPSQWWHERLKRLSSNVCGDGGFCLRRMELRDLEPVIDSTNDPVLFCGSKQLEWQVKMWLLGTRDVHCTDR
ncbi:hypothetical protein FPOA_06717 [Fusarium poae]|uniref:FAD-binding FR-type domain-containing protein n=1 Tax=Fusarium poae TaxID=36050 RepID=A0A1B8AIE7_FUSPO|nr:hypothetical protein FPOA_06717 [Fusarium poae]